jgi:hypothetical protein
MSSRSIRARPRSPRRPTQTAEDEGQARQARAEELEELAERRPDARAEQRSAAEKKARSATVEQRFRFTTPHSDWTDLGFIRRRTGCALQMGVAVVRISDTAYVGELHRYLRDRGLEVGPRGPRQCGARFRRGRRRPSVIPRTLAHARTRRYGSARRRLKRGGALIR